MQSNNKVLLDAIEREKSGVDYYCPEADKEKLINLFEEINQYAGTNIQYLAELDAVNIKGSGEIIARHISKFSSESVKCYLIPQMVFDGIHDCDKILLNLYLNFKASNEYISKPGIPAPSHIYVRYDNAFKSLKPKRLTKELIMLVHEPRDAFYLPFTTKMLASWKPQELEDLLIKYSSKNNIVADDVDIFDESELVFPSFSFIKRELRFIAIDSLKYYPSKKSISIIEQYTFDSDRDIRSVANRTLKILTKQKCK